MCYIVKQSQQQQKKQTRYDNKKCTVCTTITATTTKRNGSTWMGKKTGRIKTVQERWKKKSESKSKEGSSCYFNKREKQRNTRNTTRITRTTKKKHGSTCLGGRIKAAQERWENSCKYKSKEGSLCYLNKREEGRNVKKKTIELRREDLFEKKKRWQLEFYWF